MKQFTTRSGKAVFPIGVGTWNISSNIDRSRVNELYKGTYAVRGNETKEIEALRYSIKMGQNHLDCAELYGAFYTDEVVGRAIKNAERGDLFIADKLWKSSVGVGKVRPTVERMLEKLGTDYLDMLYIHAPWEGVRWQEAIPQIDQLIDEGIVRNFGVSNFTLKDMQDAQKLACHPIAANQMNYNVLYQDEVGPEFRAYCQANDIAIVAYQPLKRQEVYKSSVIRNIAQAHKASEAQIALAWLLAMSALPIPKAVNHRHIDENIAAIDIILSDQEIAALHELSKVA